MNSASEVTFQESETINYCEQLLNQVNSILQKHLSIYKGRENDSDILIFGRRISHVVYKKKIFNEFCLLKHY